MKKKSYSLIYTMAFTLCLSNITIAQKRDIAFNYPTKTDKLFSAFGKMGFKETNADNFNIKAVRDFLKTFETVYNNRWSLNNNGHLTSTFTSAGSKTKVVYDNNGSRLYILRVYGEDKMSYNMRNMIKRQYYNATVTMIKELETVDCLATYVHLQDKDTWKVVRIVDGEMELIENFHKG